MTASAITGSVCAFDLRRMVGIARGGIRRATGVDPAVGSPVTAVVGPSVTGMVGSVSVTRELVE